MVTNIYFLAIMIICCIPQISTVTPITSIIPLVLVLVVAAIKEIYEDIRRYLADRKFNNNKYIQRLNEEEIYVKSSKIKTGSLIKLQSDDIVPADCIPLSTINKDGVVYVETAAIDGETNLKQILVPPHFIDRPITTIWEDSGDLICEYPQPRFDQFRGSITTNDVKVSVNEKNLLLQGTVIRNTEFVYCLVCYCGKHTKLTLNQTKPKLKKSTIDFKFNVFVFVMIIIQCLLCLLLAILSAIRYNTINDEENGYWYLPKEDFSPLLQAVKKFFGYFTLISYIIPISCQVSLEFARFAQGLFIEADADMKIKTVSATGKTVVAGMNAKATALNDELGMVRYILTDKTGTLTENQMTFSNCSVGNVVYDTDQMKKLLKITGHDVIIQTTKTESIEDDIVVNDVDRNSTNTISNSQQNNNQDNVSNEINLTTPRTHSENIDDLDDKSKADSLIQLLMCMAMCNTISINNDKFTSPSPDEEALCKTAKNVGVQLIQRTQQKIKLFLFGKECEYHILSTFEFNSDRKRMSILLRDENGVISLWSKGADNIMKERCNDGFESLQHIEQFSKNGLRTLVLAHKIVGEETFSKWYEKYDDANNLLEGRDEAVDQLQSEMENEMCIIGVTAIEDQLQAGVPETIDLLKRGGIKIWIITGDKMETAINIGLSCDLLNEKYVCIAKDTQEECGIVVSTLVDQFEKKELTNFTLVINDRNVDWCIHDFQKDFVKLALASEGVVCCRVTPLQKAEITKCVKKMTKKTCLAIGDGANDVPMINTGDIGVGIFGKEGSQAARASDFAIRKFRHLGKLVLYHGRMSLLRNSTLIKMCFYKNASFFMILMWYSFISNHTCQIVYDDYIMTFFNIFFTQIQPIVTGVVERDLTWQTIQRVPECNKEMFKNPRSSVYSFIGWFLFGIYQSLVFFFIMYWCIIPNDVSSLSGKSGGMVFTSVTVTMYSLFGIIITLIIETRTWDIISISGHVISIILIFVIYGLTCYIPGFSTMDMSWFGLSQTFSQPNFYLASILAIVITNLPILLKKYLERRFSPQFWHIAQEIERSLHSNYGKKRIIHTEGSPELYQYIRSTLPILPKITHSQQLITNADPSSASSDDKRVSIDTDLSSVHVLPRSDD